MRRPLQTIRESGIALVLATCALLSIGTTFAIIAVLSGESFAFFAGGYQVHLPDGSSAPARSIGLFEYLFGTRWSPQLEPQSFGVLPLVSGTFVIAIGALLIAVPIGLASALYLSEYATRGVRGVAKPVLELLAGVPTVVYGFFALTFITPYIIQPLFPQAQALNALSAAIVVGVMIIPTIASLSDDAFRAVPQGLRDGAYALAATKYEVSARIVLPGALSGVVASVLLALARAVGETMAVAMAAGSLPTLIPNPLQSTQTMTGYIVEVMTGYAAEGSTPYRALFAVGVTLFAITLVINLLAQRVLRRFQEKYE